MDEVENICIWCGKKFTTKKGLEKKYCDRECYIQHIKTISRKDKEKWKKVKCSYCGNEIEVRINKNNENYFCDKECYMQYHSVDYEERQCAREGCKNTFIIKKEDSSKYCCRQCYVLDYKPPKNFYNFHYKGYYFSSKNYKRIWFDSSYELSRMKQLDEDINVKSWDRATSIKIQYKRDDGSLHMYTPDFIVYYDNKVVIEEVKGRFNENTIVKITAGRKWAEERKLEYKILCYNDILDIQNVEYLPDSYSNQFGDFHRISFLTIWMRFAVLMSERSTCLRNKVGCVIVTDDFRREYSHGYNGSAHGDINGCKTLEPGMCGCIHAEDNALRKVDEMKIDIINGILFSTVAPCIKCAEKIIKYNIKKVIYLNPYRKLAGLNLLKKNNIEVYKYDDLVLEANKNKWIR